MAWYEVFDLVRLVSYCCLIIRRCLHITDSWSSSGTEARLSCTRDLVCASFSRTFDRSLTDTQSHSITIYSVVMLTRPEC